jgi:hypothetical protein
MIILVLWLLKLAVKATLARLTLLEVSPCEVRDDVTLLDYCGIPNHLCTSDSLILNGTKVVNVRCRETVLRLIKLQPLPLSASVLEMEERRFLGAKRIRWCRRLQKDVVPPHHLLLVQY